MSVSKRGFPGLDGLRFYAALGVAITHAEQVASWASVANVYPLVSTPSVIPVCRDFLS